MPPLRIILTEIGGNTHLFFEGYFMYNHARVSEVIRTYVDPKLTKKQMGSRMDLFGQLWKEYALSDSRYLTSDPFVLCMETITAVWKLDMPPSFALLTLLYRYHGVHCHS
jgi:cholestenol Delta-isomerase